MVHKSTWRLLPPLLLSLCLAGGMFAPALAAEMPATNTLQSVDHGILPGGRIVVRARFAQPVTQAPAMFRTHHPRQNVVLDFPATTSGDEVRELTFRGVDNIRVVQAGELTRLVVNLERPRTPHVELRGREVWLTLTPFEAPRPAEDAWFLKPAR